MFHHLLNLCFDIQNSLTQESLLMNLSRTARVTKIFHLKVKKKSPCEEQKRTSSLSHPIISDWRRFLSKLTIGLFVVDISSITSQSGKGKSILWKWTVLWSFLHPDYQRHRDECIFIADSLWWMSFEAMALVSTV